MARGQVKDRIRFDIDLGRSVVEARVLEIQFAIKAPESPVGTYKLLIFFFDFAPVVPADNPLFSQNFWHHLCPDRLQVLLRQQRVNSK
jgi:hypothetical protein